MTKSDIEKLKNIDCFAFDLDGTIYIDRTLIDGAKETIDFLREKGKKVIFLTNNSSVSAKYYVKNQRYRYILQRKRGLYLGKRVGQVFES